MAGFTQQLQAEKFLLVQTKPSDFEPLFKVASDPLIWEQHPARDRWRPEVFSAFFDDGLRNDLGCFTIVDSQSIVLLGRHDFTPTTHQMPRFDWVTHSLLDGTGAPVPTN